MLFRSRQQDERPSRGIRSGQSSQLANRHRVNGSARDIKPKKLPQRCRLRKFVVCANQQRGRSSAAPAGTDARPFISWPTPVQAAWSQGSFVTRQVRQPGPQGQTIGTVGGFGITCRHKALSNAPSGIWASRRTISTQRSFPRFAFPRSASPASAGFVTTPATELFSCMHAHS